MEELTVKKMIPKERNFILIAMIPDSSEIVSVTNGIVKVIFNWDSTHAGASVYGVFFINSGSASTTIASILGGR